MKLAVQNTKGGTSKTATTMFLAEAVHRAGQTVTVWDADPQGTATTWHDNAAAAGQPLPFTVEPINRQVFRRQDPGTEVVIADTPPGDPQIVSDAFDWADLTIIATGPDGSDVERAAATYHMAHGAPALVLLTQFDKREKESWETWRSLQGSSIPSFDTRIPDRTAISSAYSHALPRDLYGYDRVYKETQQVIKHLTQGAN